MKPFKRADRIAGHVQKALSDLLRKKIKDPRLDTVTITGVRVSSDLRLARVYYSINGDQKAKTGADAGFKRAKGHIKRALAKNLGLRYMPDLQFFYDESFDYGSRIDRLLQSINSDNEANSQ